MGWSDDVRCLGLLAWTEACAAVRPLRFGPILTVLSVASVVAGFSLEAPKELDPSKASWQTWTHQMETSTRRGPIDSKHAPATHSNTASEEAHSATLSLNLREGLGVTADIARELLAGGVGSLPNSTGDQSLYPKAPAWASFPSGLLQDSEELLEADGVELRDGQADPAALLAQGLSSGWGEGVIVDAPRDISKPARVWYVMAPESSPLAERRRQAWIARLLESRMESGVESRLAKAGLHSTALAMAPSHIERVAVPGAVITLAGQEASRLASLIVALSFQLGLFGGAIFGFMWLARQGEGSFELYARSARPAWSTGLALPLGYALFSWSCLALGLGLGFLVSLALGGSMTPALLAQGMGACLCGSLMGSMAENFAVSLSTNPLVRSVASTVPLGLFAAASSWRSTLSEWTLWAVGPELHHTLSDAVSHALGLSADGSGSLVAMSATALVVALLASFGIHFRIGRFRRTRWQARS